MKKFPEQVKKAKAELEVQASKIAEPASNVMNTVVVGGLSAGLLLGVAYLINRLRK